MAGEVEAESDSQINANFHKLRTLVRDYIDRVREQDVVNVSEG